MHQIALMMSTMVHLRYCASDCFDDVNDGSFMLALTRNYQDFYFIAAHEQLTILFELNKLYIEV